jgi:hypothetical protein
MDYRSHALKLFPHVCARCARHFPAHRLRELTVHHKDGNHDNNPADGANWELLCIYCHENEHARVEDSRAGGNAKQSDPEPARHRPLAGLDKLMQKKKKPPEGGF